jgi:hypothetical protein
MKADVAPVIDGVDTIPPVIAHQYCPCQWSDTPAVVTALCGTTVPINGIKAKPSTPKCSDCLKLDNWTPCPVCGHMVGML